MDPQPSGWSNKWEGSCSIACPLASFLADGVHLEALTRLPHHGGSP